MMITGVGVRVVESGFPHEPFPPPQYQPPFGFFATPPMYPGHMFGGPPPLHQMQHPLSFEDRQRGNQQGARPRGATRDRGKVMLLLGLWILRTTRTKVRLRTRFRIRGRFRRRRGWAERCISK
jgi:hypothetical protein